MKDKIEVLDKGRGQSRKKKKRGIIITIIPIMIILSNFGKNYFSSR